MADTAKALAQQPQIEGEADLCTEYDLYDLFGAEDGFDLDDPAAENALFEGQDASYTQGRGAELKGCVLRRCNLRGLRWHKASFTDVVFENCDLSNSRFYEAYFQRVRFVGCKLVGTDAVDALLRNVTFDDSLMRMLNLSGAKLTGVTFTDCDLTEASLRMLQEMKRISLTRCDLTRAELTQTRLKGLDLTTCRLQGLQLTGAYELTGAYVSPDQAIQLSSLLGVLLKP